MKNSKCSCSVVFRTKHFRSFLVRWLWNLSYILYSQPWNWFLRIFGFRFWYLNISFASITSILFLLIGLKSRGSMEFPGLIWNLAYFESKISPIINFAGFTFSVSGGSRNAGRRLVCCGIVVIVICRWRRYCPSSTHLNEWFKMTCWGLKRSFTVKVSPLTQLLTSL